MVNVPLPMGRVPATERERDFNLECVNDPCLLAVWGIMAKTRSLETELLI